MFVWEAVIMILPLVVNGARAADQSYSTLDFPPLPLGFKDMAQKLMNKCPRMGNPFPLMTDNMNSSKVQKSPDPNPFFLFPPLFSSLPPQPKPQPPPIPNNANQGPPSPSVNLSITDRLMNCSNLLLAIELMRNSSEVQQCFLRAFLAPLAWDALVVNGTGLKPKERDLLLWGAKLYLQDPPPSLSVFPSQLDRTQLTEIMRVFSETFGSLYTDQRTKIMDWAKQQVYQVYFNCSVQTPVGAKPTGALESKPQRQETCLVGTWLTADVMDTMGRFLTLLPPSEFKSISKVELCSFFQSSQFPASFRGLGDDISPLGKTLLDRVKQDCYSDQQAYLQNPEKLGPLACFLGDTSSFNISLSENMLSQLGECKNSGAEKLKKELVKKLISVKDKILNSDLVKSMGTAVSSLPPSRLANLSLSAVQDNLPVLGTAKWETAQSVVLARTVLKGAQSVSAKDLLSLGSIVRGVSCSVLRKVDYQELLGSEALANLSRELSDLQRHALMDGLFKNISTTDFLGSLPDELLSSLSLDMLGKAKLQSVEQLKVRRWNRAQATLIVGKLLGGKMEPKDLGNLSSAVQGVTCEMITKTNQSNAMEMVQMLALNANWLSRTQVMCAVKKLLGQDGNLTSVDLNAIPTLLLVQLSPKSIGSLPKSLCSTFLGKVAQANLSSLPAKSLSRLAFVDKALICLGKNLSVVSSDDISRLGNLVCELDVGRLSILPPDAINATLLALAKCSTIQRGNAEIILKLLKVTYGDPSTWSSDIMTSLGPLLLLNESIIMSLPYQSWLKEALQNILDKLPPIPTPASAELFPSSQDLSTLNMKLFSLTTASTPIRARREVPTAPSITPPTLQDIEELKDRNVYWSAAYLASIATQTFIDGVSTLGLVTNYSDLQLQALRNKAQQVWGMAGSLSEPQIQELKCVLRALNNTDLQNLNITSLDTLDQLSSCNWSHSQRTALCVGFMNRTGRTPANLGSVEIVGLGPFLCGLSPKEAGQLKPESFRDSLRSAGRISCPADLTVQLKEVAVKTFGAPANWTAAQVNSLGNILAGLSSAELQSLNSSVMAFITQSAIPLIPPAVLAALPVSQLQALGPDNAAMITDAQKQSMKDDQRAAVAETVGVPYSRADTGVTTLKPATPLPQKAGADGQNMMTPLFFLQPVLLLVLGYAL